MDELKALLADLLDKRYIVCFAVLVWFIASLQLAWRILT